VLISQTAEIDPTAVLGPNVVIGPGAKIGPGARLQRCVVLSNAVIRDHSWIANSIIGWNSNVGRWVSDSAVRGSGRRADSGQTRVENITVLGDDVTIKDELYVNGASVLPHKSVSLARGCNEVARLTGARRSRPASPSRASSCDLAAD
jgi:mannose-1-phosphate guanylyltransferase